jgi:hypothetical protein
VDEHSQKTRYAKILKKLYQLLIFYSLVLPVSYNSQSTQNKPLNGSSNSAMMVNGTDHDTCLNKSFSVVFYVIQDTTLAKNISSVQQNEILTVMKVLNNYFARICVTFQNCSTVVIPNYEYNKWTMKVDKDVTDNWYIPNTINIYLVEELVYKPEFEEIGYAHAPGIPGAKFSNKEVMVFQYMTVAPDKKKNIMDLNSSGVQASAVAHAAGHFFGLPDTFSELAGSPMGTYEMVRRTNCDVTGDGICDTEADPFPLSYFPPPGTVPKGAYCRYWPVLKDSAGDYYTPPIDNMMSMYLCRCRFTQQQYNHMARYILKNKWHLH